MQTWKTTFQRIAAMVCALALCASMVPAAVFAEPADTTEQDNGTSIVAENDNTEPGAEPEEPGAEPEEPGTEPEEPGTEPKEPGTEPEEPGTEPKEPGTEPKEPGTEPKEPAAEPKQTDSTPAVQDVTPARAPENVETVYSDDEKGIEVTVETGAVVERTVNFVIVVDGEVVEDGIQVGNLPIGGTDVTILADRYKVSTSIDGSLDELGTFTHKSGNIYWLVPTSNNITARIELTSFKTADDIEIANGDTVYGTFSWMKGNADRDDFERTLTIEVNGEQVHTQTVYTPQTLNNAPPSTAQYWFTPNSSAYNAEVGMNHPNALDTVASKDLTIRLTTKCPCGSAWCECPGGADCTCQTGCDCELCQPAADEKEIRTDYGVISYKEPSAGGYNMTVEVYVNGTKEFTSKALRIRGSEADSLNFEPANGYYYYNDENSYDIVTKNAGSWWDQRTGEILIVGTLEEDRDFSNVLKVYLWTFENHIKLNVDCKGDADDVVTGYVISFDAYDPATKITKTYTYTATSFLLAQAQMIPYATNVTLTPICEAPYEVSQWSTADAYTALTLRGSEGQAGTEAYGNHAILYMDNTAYDSLTVNIDGVRSVARPTEGELIGNIGDIFADDAAVVVDCVNTEENHANKTSGLKADTFKIGDLLGNSADGYYVEVTVDPNSYVESYDKDFDVEHTRTDTGDKVITLNWKVVTGADNNKTSAWRAEEPATVKVTCDGGEEPGPGPEEPDAPTVDELNALLNVVMTCQTNAEHSKTYENLLADSYEVTEPADNACTVTVKAESYVTDMGGDHQIVGNETAMVDLVYDNGWKLADGEDGTVAFTVKCETAEPEPEEPDAPTVDELNALLNVVMTCQTNAEHSKTYENLLADSYEVTEPADNACTVTVKAESYVTDMGGDHQIVGNETATVDLVYDNGWKLADGENGTVEFTVKCETTTEPGTPGTPTQPDLEGLGQIVTVHCDNTKAQHTDKSYNVLANSYLCGDVVTKDNEYYVSVEISADQYVAAYNKDIAEGHTLKASDANPAKQMLDLRWDAQANKWVLAEDANIQFNVICETSTEPEIPQLPGDDVISELYGENVVVTCTNADAKHPIKRYALADGSFKTAMHYEGGQYYLLVEADPASFAARYSTDTGATHSAVTTTVTPLRFNYDPATGTWSNDTSNPLTNIEVKCTTATVPGEGGDGGNGGNGGNNDQPRDEHPDIAEGIANGTWGKQHGATPTPAANAAGTAVIPQTADTLPVAQLVLAMAVAGVGALALFLLRKHSCKGDNK